LGTRGGTPSLFSCNGGRLGAGLAPSAGGSIFKYVEKTGTERELLKLVASRPYDALAGGGYLGGCEEDAGGTLPQLPPPIPIAISN